LDKQLPPCNVPVIAHAVNGVHYRAIYDGVDFAPMLASGKVLQPFRPGAVEAWSHLPDHDYKSTVVSAYVEMCDGARELRDLERRIAYRAARNDIRSRTIETVEGHNTRNVLKSDAERVAECVRYLDFLGKLKRREGAPHIVRILDLEGA
jgi:hypothetical protein